MLNRDKFLRRHGVRSKFLELEKREPNLWEEMEAIFEDYVSHRKELERLSRQFSNSIDDSKEIHSVRRRVKEADSVLVKIIKKKIQNVNSDNKYNNINRYNYQKIITDLIGVRIIIRYRTEWQDIHEMIWKRFYKGKEKYVHDYENDYNKEPQEPFIAEKPIVYYRHAQSRKNYEVFGRNVFNIVLSDIGYSSIHYIINYYGCYVELQVRTIYDEAWSECDHDFVYKLNASAKKLVLKRSSRMLSDITGLADNMSSFIRDYYTEEIFEEHKQKPRIMPQISMEKEKDEKEIHKMHGKYESSAIEISRVSDVYDLF